MFWLRVKSIFLKNISLFIALAILAAALALYFPSLGQGDRLIEKRDDLEKEGLQVTNELSEAILLRDDLHYDTEEVGPLIEEWNQRVEKLKGYLVNSADASKNSKDTAENTNKNGEGEK